VKFYEEIEYLIDVLKNADSNSNDTDALDRLEKLLGEYAKKYQQQKVRRDDSKI